MKIIAKYKNEKLSEPELEAISEQLIQAKLDRDKKKEWTQKLKEEYQVVQNTKTLPPKRKTKLWLFSAAAAILLLISIFLLIPQTNETDYIAVVDHHIETLAIMSDQSVFRKGGPEVEALRKKANLSYVNKEYEAGIPYWEQLIASSEATSTDYFYLAISHLKKANADPQQTISLLLKSTSLGSSLEEETAWVLALVYLKVGNTTAGIQELSRIVENNSYQAKEAKRILEMIK